MAKKSDESTEESAQADDKKTSAKTDEKKDDFRYIIRIASTDLDGNRKIQFALTGIKGVGHRVANVICKRAGMDPTAVLGYMKPDEVINDLVALIV